MTSGLSRRHLLKLLAGAISLNLSACASNQAPLVASCRPSLPEPDTGYPSHVVDVVNDTVVVDLLAALETQCRRGWFAPPFNATVDDVEYLNASGITIFHVSPGLPERNAYEEAVKFVNRVKTAAEKHPHAFTRVLDSDDIVAAKKSGHCGILIGLQNSTHFRSVDDVTAFWDMGQRISQITQNERNRLGCGAKVEHDEGLTPYGADIIRHMNRRGMIVDLSHCGDQTTLDAIAASTKPVLITHANCRALNPGYKRCKTDEAIRKMAAAGGVMGLSILRAFVRDQEPTTIEHFLDHVDHIARIAGIEHVGIGSDQDIAVVEPDVGAQSAYYRNLPPKVREFYRFREKTVTDGLNQTKRMYAIADGLSRRGYGDKEIQGVLGMNALRVMRENWVGSAP